MLLLCLFLSMGGSRSYWYASSLQETKEDALLRAALEQMV